MFRFASPFAFLLVLPLALMIWRIYARRVTRGVLLATATRVPTRGGTWRKRAQQVCPPLLVLGLLLAILALARPQQVFSRMVQRTDAIAIQMVTDISGSMNGLDFATRQNPYITRLDVVKEIFGNFVERRPGDLIGLVTFGGYAVSRVPLTVDHDALSHVLEGIEVPRYQLNGQGNVINGEELATAIGDGLATACARLRDSEVASRIVVLLSDGESNAGVVTPKEATAVAQTLGIKVYTIGVGSDGEAPVKIVLSDGRTEVHRSPVKLDRDLLRGVAADTGGRYFHVRDTEGLESALEAIDQLERTEINREVYSQYNELFLRFLLPALGLLSLGTIINVCVARRIA